MGVEQFAQAFPVKRAGGLSAVQFLCVEEGAYRVTAGRRVDLPLHRVAGLRGRAEPVALRLHAHLLGRKVSAGRAGRAVRPARPQGAAVGAAQHEGCQGAAVVEIDADPVPAACLRVQQLFAPFMIEPGPALHRPALALQFNAAARVQLGLAVVVAGLAELRALARKAAIALQQHRLGGVKAQGQAQAAGRQAGVVGAGLHRSFAPKMPAAQPQVGVVRGGLGQPKAFAGDGLVVPEPTRRHIADGHMGKDELAGRKA